MTAAITLERSECLINEAETPVLASPKAQRIQIISEETNPVLRFIVDRILVIIEVIYDLFRCLYDTVATVIHAVVTILKLAFNILIGIINTLVNRILGFSQINYYDWEHSRGECRIHATKISQYAASAIVLGTWGLLSPTMARHFKHDYIIEDIRFAPHPKQKTKMIVVKQENAGEKPKHIKQKRPSKITSPLSSSPRKKLFTSATSPAKINLDLDFPELEPLPSNTQANPLPVVPAPVDNKTMQPEKKEVFAEPLPVIPAPKGQDLAKRTGRQKTAHNTPKPRSSSLVITPDKKVVPRGYTPKMDKNMIEAFHQNLKRSATTPNSREPSPAPKKTSKV